MKYFLICFLLIISCKSSKDAGNFDDKDAGHIDVVIGTAVNEKAGAVLFGEDGTYLIEGVNIWDSTYISKKVKVTGCFRLIVGANIVYFKDKKTHKLIGLPSQMYARYYSVTDATWELYDSIR